jgi:hypothetical protein
MKDLNELLHEIEELPKLIYEANLKMIVLQNEYETLKESIKHKRAAIVTCFNDMPHSKAETMSYASNEYKNMLASLSVARLEYLKASAYYELLNKKYDSNKTQQISIMAQMKLA